MLPTFLKKREGASSQHISKQHSSCSKTANTISLKKSFALRKRERDRERDGEREGGRE